MNRILIFLLSSVVTMCGFQARAQRDSRIHESGVVSVAINGAEATDSIVEQSFKSNAPEVPRDNGLPRFAIVGKDGKFFLGIGAQFLGEAVFDWGASMPSAINMTPSAITPAEAGNGASMRFAWQTSSVHMNIVAMPDSPYRVGLFVKVNFNGGDRLIHCRHFYAHFMGLTAGYTYSAFTDGGAETFTIDDEGPNGFPSMSLFTAYWQQRFSDRFSGAIGVDESSASLGSGDEVAAVNQRIPAFPAYLQSSWQSGAGHLRLSGILRPLQYRNLGAGHNSTMLGRAVQLSGVVPFTPDLSMQFSGVYGSGIAQYLQDDNGLGLDALASASRPGEMSLVRSMGITAGASYSITSRLSSNLVYSHLSNWAPCDVDIPDGQYRAGDYVAANVVYAINKFVSAGLEYDYGHRRGFNGSGLHTNRLQCQLAVTF